MKVRKKPVEVEAITFQELVDHGIMSGANLIDGIPWSFNYKGHPITHENDDCYLVPTLNGSVKFNRGELLITGVEGEIYPIKLSIFNETHEIVDETAAPRTLEQLATECAGLIATDKTCFVVVDGKMKITNIDALSRIIKQTLNKATTHKEKA